MTQLKPVPVHLGVIRLHPLASIFFFNNPKISRPVRFSLFYLRITLILSVTGLFSEDTSIYQNILIGILTGLLTILPLTIIKVFLKMKK